MRRLRVSPAGQVRRFGISGTALMDPSASELALDSEPGIGRPVPASWTELVDLSGAHKAPRPKIRSLHGRPELSGSRPSVARLLKLRGLPGPSAPWRPVACRIKSHSPVVIAAAVLVTVGMAGPLLIGDVGDSSSSPPMATATGQDASRLAGSPWRTRLLPASSPGKLDVVVTAHERGPLTAEVRTTAASTVATLTIWHDGHRIAMRRLHLTWTTGTWSSRAVPLSHTTAGRYRWVATAPGAPRVTGTYQVPTQAGDQPSTRPSAPGVTPSPTPVPSTGSTPAAPPSTLQPTQQLAQPSPAGTPSPTPHEGPVPGGGSGPIHTGPRP